MKPRKLFIGSSTKFINLAKAFRMTFERDNHLRVEVWEVSRWRENRSNLSQLIDFLDQYQFGVFLLTPDDFVKTSEDGEPTAAPRDNVIFELGLWFGRAGRDRTWYLVPKNYKLKLPTDLDGLNTIKYDHPEPTEYMRSSAAEFQPLFATAHDLVIDNIHAYQRKAKEPGFFFSQIRRLQERIKTASEDEAIEMVREGIGWLLLERAALSKTSITDTLRDVLLWTRALLDGLDSEQLAEEQDHKLDEVWVFAPEPLETLVS
ncbi:MAG: nucleotide-binding protein [Acidobacteriia bacterium]|nr:nucleotide-binding protein [Terriglobia bacterium]